MGPAGGAMWKTLKVDERGEVSPAMLKGVKVEGLSEGEATKAIAKAYRAQGILPAAQVAHLRALFGQVDRIPCHQRGAGGKQAIADPGVGCERHEASR